MCRLYRHLGRITHVVVPWEHTWTFMAKCVGADVARVTAWAIIGSMVLAGALVKAVCLAATQTARLTGFMVAC